MRFWWVVPAILVIACSGSSPAPPSVGTPPGAITIRGTEKLGWDQSAADANELSGIGFEAYVDDLPFPVNGVACGTVATAAGFACKAPLPSMTPGSHTLELSSFFLSNPSAKSARAGPLNVVLSVSIGAPAASLARTRSAEGGSREQIAKTWPAGTRGVAAGLDRPADLAFTPDARLLVAERSGRIRVLRDATVLEPPALALPSHDDSSEGAVLALAVDPAFDRTHFVYAIYTETTRSGALAFTLARFREAGNTLADRIVLLDNVPAAPDPNAVLRFGPDGKLYAAFDDGGDERNAQDPASFNGKVLRLNPDGTTPDDAPRKSPILLEGLASPRGIGWHAATQHLWVANGPYVGAFRWTSMPHALAVAGNNLFVASEGGIMRATLDLRVPGRISAAADLFEGIRVQAVAVRQDGTLYFAADDAVGVVER